MRSYDSLIQLFDPLFEKLAASSWESVGMNHIWNPRRPIWFQSIIHLIEPHLVPVIKDLLRYYFDLMKKFFKLKRKRKK